MKTRKMTLFVTICCIGIAALVLLACRSKANNVKQVLPEGRLVEFTYHVSGSTYEPLYDYRLVLLDDGTASLMSAGMSSPVKDTVVVARDVLDRVASIIAEHKMQNYKSSYQTEYDILDGKTWSYCAVYDSKKSLSSGGYEAYPDDNGLQEIIAYLDTCLLEKTTKTKRK